MTCMKTCGLCKAKKPCVNKKEKAAKAKVEKDKKKLVRDRKIAAEKKAKAYAAAKKAAEKKKKSAVAAAAKAKAAAAKKADEKKKKAKAAAAKVKADKAKKEKDSKAAAKKSRSCKCRSKDMVTPAFMLAMLATPANELVESPKMCGGNKCVDKSNSTHKTYYKKKVTDLCAYRKTWGNCKNENGYRRRYSSSRCSKTCTGKGRDTLKLDNTAYRRRRPKMGTIAVRKVYKSKCLYYKAVQPRSCKPGTWLSKYCPKTCHGSKKAHAKWRLWETKRFVSYRAKVKTTQSYCTYWKSKGYCKSKKGSWRYRYSLRNCQKTCGMCKLGTCIDTRRARKLTRNVYERKYFKSRCAFAKAEKRCSINSWNRSNWYKKRCQKTCTGRGVDKWKPYPKPRKHLVQTYKKWKNRCAFFKHHKSSNCKNNGWVRRHCQKTCSGRGKDSWHPRTYYQGIYKITGRKTYASYCAWMKNRGDCHLTSMKRTCMKTCGLCKAKKPCKKSKSSDRKIAAEKKKKAAKAAAAKKSKSSVAKGDTCTYHSGQRKWCSTAKSCSSPKAGVIHFMKSGGVCQPFCNPKRGGLKKWTSC